MSSPSPETQKSPDLYPSNEATDLLKHPHVCTCGEKSSIDLTEISHKNIHHHNAINLGQASHVHPVNVHVHASPKSGHSVKMTSPACSCHLQDDRDVGQDARDVGGGRKLDPDDRIEISPLPPALPPRPPPRPRFEGHGTLLSRSPMREVNTNKGGIRKYVFWCCVCGGLATIVGSLFLAVYFLLRSYTSTLGYFETIPTFVPATMLILTGLCIMSLARRKNRYSYLIKVCGICCLVCALTCVLVTITTTVIHMNRLQTLRECLYTQATNTCTCYSILREGHTSTEEGFVFDSTPNCEVIHGALYSCLRAMFGLSVSGILVCIFSCMLVYQLLSHEKKKMYWEQLELRCRSFYQQQGAPPTSTTGSMRGPPLPPATYCSCCEECRYPSIPAGPQVYPWDSHHSTDRFWTPGRVGNFYSPNPGDDLPAIDGHSRERSGWNWRRLPWNRGNTTHADPPRDNSMTYQGAASSADSQYGFSNGSENINNPMDPASGSSGSYSMLDNRPVGGVYVWGPPPPYSNPNSPARRSLHSPARYHHIHHHLHGHDAHCQMNEENQTRNDMHMRRSRVQFTHKDNYENTPDAEVHQCNNDASESTDTSSCADRVPHTLPVRKMKKRVDVSSVKSTMQNNRTNVQNVFNNQSQESQPEHNYNEPNLPEMNQPNANDQCRFLPRLQGVENEAFQKQENSPQKQEPTESEVYFADVSSCCNISVKNDGQDSSVYDEAVDTQKPRLISLQCVHKQNKENAANKQLLQSFQENIASAAVAEDEEYLIQRMGKMQMSTRSRLPFPLPSNESLSEVADPCMQLLPKDISQNSLCSSVQTPLTETTDDAVTPESPSFPKSAYFQEKKPQKPFSNDQFLAPDAQYEIIDEQDSFRQNPNAPSFSNLTNTISGLSNYGQSYIQPNFVQKYKNTPPKTLNLNQSNRRNLGSNISTLIQNLGVNPAGLLYGEAHSAEDEIQGQGCHSDGTMDSGWQSGSEKQEKKEDCEVSAHKSVNI